MKHANIIRSTIFAVAAMAAMGAVAEPEVTDVVAKQRYPWNGLVDITCNVTGITGAAKWKFALEAVKPDSSAVTNVTNFWVVQNGTNSTDREVHVNGDYRLLWDARADLGQVHYDNMVVRITCVVIQGKVQLWEGGPYWAETNIGAKEPWEYGYYFWWGDTIGYKRENDKWVATDGSSSNFSFSSDNTPTSNKRVAALKSEGWITAESELVPEHDAAHVQWGGNWRMPTDAEFLALINNCTIKQITTNGVSGRLVTGKGAYADRSIFLPAAGYGLNSSLSLPGSFGCYWSSTPYSRYSDYANNLFFDSSSFHTSIYHCSYGQSVRPVQVVTAVTVTFDGNGGTVSSSSRSYAVNGTYGSLPTATRTGYTFAGWFTAASGGTQVTSSSTVPTSSTTLYAHWTANADSNGKVQLWEGGPYWAETNIGADEPEEYGYYFWWGDTVGYKRENGKWVASDGSSSNFSFSSSNVPTYDKSIATLQSGGWITADSVLAAEHDAAHVHWGGNWRMPTEQELSDLDSKCTWTWTTRNGVNGYEVRGKGAYASVSIFLPAAGIGNGTSSLLNASSYGYFWSSVPYSDGNYSWYLRFYSSGHGTTYSNRYLGFAVRPVQGFTK